MEGEQDRLTRLYGELGDEHLLDLADDTEELTPEAEAVLKRELERRGLTPAPAVVAEPEAGPGERTGASVGSWAGVGGIFPSSPAMMGEALEPRQTREGMSSLISFYDGIELGKACDLLEEAGMEPSIEPVGGDAMTGVPPRYEVWLDTEDIEAAKTLLRAKMGLFPLAEVDGEAPATGLVGVFPMSGDAEVARELLAEAGIAATVVADEETEEWEVRVAPEEQERAIEVVASGMGLG